MSGTPEGQTVPSTIAWQSSGAVTEINDTLQQLQRLRSRVRELGCDIKPSSRIAVFEKRFMRFMKPGYDPRRDPDFDPIILAHGCRDLFELTFICEKLTDIHGSQLSEAIPHLLSGAPVPSVDRNQNPRNLQFQYFLAAYLAHSGFNVTLAEPDAVFVHHETELGIAAKRPISAQQVVHRVREGVRQLENEQLTGFIALSVDRLLSVSHPYLVASGEAALDAAAQKHVREVLVPYAKPVQRAIADSNITGIIFSLILVGCVRVPWQPAHTTATLWLPREDDLPLEGGLVKSVVKALKGPSVA